MTVIFINITLFEIIEAIVQFALVNNKRKIKKK